MNELVKLTGEIKSVIRDIDITILVVLAVILGLLT